MPIPHLKRIEASGMDKKSIKFDAKTKTFIDNLSLTIQQAESELQLVCQVYLNAKGKDFEKHNFQLLPDNSGLIKVEANKNDK